ncbi:putative F-box protein PP2-B12 [Rutidosis leptorrhynchoides]|uniref:putative F-box protein PP2-B12 n=1 Tax=Rutidosis leptorrhynchoides TaxID=125765 RepID=UPI003A99B849
MSQKLTIFIHIYKHPHRIEKHIISIWVLKMGGGLLILDHNEPESNELDEEFVSNSLESLPEGFVANALSLTSPRDVCRLSSVCSVFRSAAEWDAVWEKFLPFDYQKIVTETVDGGVDGLVRLGSKKEVYLSLCDRPVIIDGGSKSFWLDKWSGKRCYMLAARDLSIVWDDTPMYWRWISVPESRFSEVVELMSVCWLEVHGKINISMLSIDTCYVAYLVYKSTPNTYGFEHHPAEVSFGLRDVITPEGQMKKMYLDPEVYQSQIYEHGHVQEEKLGRRTGMFNPFRRLGSQCNVRPPLNGPKRRPDGWLEIELGEFLNEDGKQGEVEMSVMEVKGRNWKGGLIIQGIEIRPKAS